ncbi:MAG: molybdate ABC transporter substrate-binding protein [Acidobacteriota bacterium]|nr:molybdate ABC transporter substrate-binding protein [Acidobacteriota bacterium]
MSKLLGFALLLGLTLPAAAQEISVAAASDLQPAMAELGARFQRETGCRVQLTFGSSGKFFAQIQNGAPFDIFFSADMDYAKKLADAGLAEPPRQYAEGRLVLWMRKDSPLDPAKGLEVLLHGRVRRIAIANPQHAPYGRAAVAALKSAGIYEKVVGKLVFGENISQAATFVATGNAEVGVLALSLARAPAMRDEGRYSEVDRKLYPPLVQGVVLLKSAPHRDLARAFLDFVAKPESAALLRSYGFDVPDLRKSGPEKNEK